MTRVFFLILLLTAALPSQASLDLATWDDLLAASRIQRRLNPLALEIKEIEELVREYSTGRVAVVPSFFEGFGFPASEAMSCGLAIVANAAGALPEVVGTDGRCGHLVPARNARAMADAIADVLSRPGRAEAMGRAARQRIESVFRWSDAAAGLVEVFEETRRAAHRRPRAA